MVDGRDSVGGVVSRTLTWNDAEPAFAWASVAVQRTVVLPMENVLPEAGTHTGVTVPSTMSVAVAVNDATAPEGPVASRTWSPGTVTDGGVVSTTVTSNEPAAVFPRGSVAVQVTVVVPMANVGPESGVQIGVTDPATMSKAVAVKETSAPEEPVASATRSAGSVNTGGVVSLTVTEKSLEPKFPCESKDVHTTSIVAMWKIEPEAGVQTTGTDPSTRSVAVTVKSIVAPSGPVASAEISGGTTTIGGVVSSTVTWKEPVAMLPAASVAEHVTVVIPKENVEPEGGSQEGVMDPSTMSVANALKVAVAPEGPVASFVNSPGKESNGGVVSRTVTVKDAEPLLLWLSVAEQVTEVVPITNNEPDGGEQEAGIEPSTVSRADAANVAETPPGPVASKVMPAGTVTTGAVVSWTVTVNDAVPMLLWASVALQVTVVTPRGNEDPDAGKQEGESRPSTRS